MGKKKGYWVALSFKVAAESDRKVKKVKMGHELEPREREGSGPGRLREPGVDCHVETQRCL